MCGCAGCVLWVGVLCVLGIGGEEDPPSTLPPSISATEQGHGGKLTRARSFRWAALKEERFR
eukprot:5142988-Pyramimonas_sp.AAC.1